MNVNITPAPTGVFLIDYMKVTEPGPLIPISNAEDPVNFGQPRGSEYRAFGRGQNEDYRLLKRIAERANTRRLQWGAHTVVVVFWHTDNRAPLIRERLVLDQEKEWKLSHDTALLTELASSFEAFRVERFDIAEGEWKLRGIHDGIYVPRGGFILCKGPEVEVLRGFDAIFTAISLYHNSIL